MTLSTHADKALYWKQIFEDWKLSGLSRKAFCEIQNISFATFAYWRKKFNPKEEQASPQILPITIQKNTAAEVEKHSAFLVHFIGGASIEIPIALNDLTITRILTLTKNLL